MKDEEECCQKCGGELDNVLGLCIGECLEKSNSKKVKDDIEIWNEFNGKINYWATDYEDKTSLDEFIYSLKKYYTITRK